MSGNNPQNGNFAAELTGKVAQHLKAANKGAVQSQGGAAHTSGGKKGPTNHDILKTKHSPVVEQLQSLFGKQKNPKPQTRTVGRLNFRRLKGVNVSNHDSNTENNTRRRKPIQITIKVVNNKKTSDLQPPPNCIEPTTSRKSRQNAHIPRRLSVLECKWELCKYFYP
jgi:hypothetical protein